MLRDGFTSVLEARSADELRDRVVQFAHEIGFDTVTAMAVIDHPLGETEFISVHNTPEAFVDQFHNSDAFRRDPVAQHCKRQSVPIIWNQGTYTATGLGPLWEEQAPFGYANGIALALHLPEGRHFMFSVDREARLPADPVELTRIVADVQLFAVHAQDAAMRILIPPSPQPDVPQLTPRELECLRWTMDGKTAWEVGAILGISERTAVLHVNNATHKLGCINKHQAVIKALRLGLIR